jgi:hypothetical protein
LMVQAHWVFTANQDLRRTAGCLKHSLIRDYRG